MTNTPTREKLIVAAIGQAESYRTEDPGDLEVGHLYGMADLITALTLGEEESFSDTREQIARQIDQEAAKITYSVLR